MVTIPTDKSSIGVFKKEVSTSTTHRGHYKMRRWLWPDGELWLGLHHEEGAEKFAKFVHRLHLCDAGILADCSGRWYPLK
jgi:hypothetical protein